MQSYVEITGYIKLNVLIDLIWLLLALDLCSSYNSLYKLKGHFVIGVTTVSVQLDRTCSFPTGDFRAAAHF